MSKTILKTVLVLLCIYNNVYGQLTEVPLPDINLYRSSDIKDFMELSTGGILVAGTHQLVNGEEVSGLIKVDESGALDPDFNRGFSDGRRIRERSDGNLVISSANSVFLLNSSGQILNGLYSAENGLEFELLANDHVIILDYNADNTINRILLLDADGNEVTDFSITSDGTISTMAVSDNFVYFLGEFTQLNDHETTNVGRVTYSGEIDQSYRVSAVGSIRRFGDVIFPRFLLSGDELYHPQVAGNRAGGKVLSNGQLDNDFDFTSIRPGGNTWPIWEDEAGLILLDFNRLVRVDNTGEIDTDFKIQYLKGSNSVVAGFQLSDGNYLFSANNGSTEPYSFLKVSPEGVEQSDFKLRVSEQSFSANQLGIRGSDIYIGGNFNSINGDSIRTNNLFRINADGSRDESFDIGTDVPYMPAVWRGIVFDQADRVVAVGDQRLVRFDSEANGTLIPELSTLIVEDVVPYADKGLLLLRQTGFQLLNNDDEIDPFFTVPLSLGRVWRTYVLPDTSMIVLYDPAGTPQRLRVAKIKADLTLDTSFDLDISAPFFDLLRMDESNFIAIDDDGEISGDTEGAVVKFDASGVIDTTFNANYQGPVRNSRLVRRFLNKYVFFDSSTQDDLYVTDLEGNHLEEFNENLLNIVPWRIQDMELLGEDSLVFLHSSGNSVLSMVALNEAPEFVQSLLPERIAEDSILRLTADLFEVIDLNNEVEELSFFALPGNNYSVAGDSLLLLEDYTGELSFDVVVMDPSGAADTLRIALEVTPVNDTPEIMAYQGVSTFDVNSTFSLMLTDFVVEDPDNTSDELTLTVQEGDNYEVDGVNITPALDFEGEISVGVNINDALSISDTFVVRLNIETILSADLTNHASVILYPNPAQDFVKIDLGQMAANEIQVSFYTLTGTLLKHHKFDNVVNREVTIPLSVAAQALLVVIEGENGIVEKKLLYIR